MTRPSKSPTGFPKLVEQGELLERIHRAARIHGAGRPPACRPRELPHPALLQHQRGIVGQVIKQPAVATHKAAVDRPSFGLWLFN